MSRRHPWTEPGRANSNNQDSEFDLLGPRNHLSPYRDGVKWNPEDERCVIGELLWTPSSGPKQISGELFEVLRGPARARLVSYLASECLLAG